MMNKAQADIAYGFTTITRTDPAYYACWLMNNMPSASTRWAAGSATAFASDRAWRTTSSSSLDANVMEGPLLIRAGVSPENVDRAIASIDEELGRLRARRPHAEGAGRIAAVS